MDTSQLSDHFLVSTGGSNSSVFDNALVYVCRHDKDGAFGLVVNKPTATGVGELLDSLKVKFSQVDDKSKVLHGGPVKEEQVFILHSPAKEYDVTIKVNDAVGVTLSRDILAAISDKKSPEKLIFAFGYAGWEAGQLEREVGDNVWITVPAAVDIMFDLPPGERLQAAVRRLGFNFNDFSNATGRA